MSYSPLDEARKQIRNISVLITERIYEVIDCDVDIESKAYRHGRSKKYKNYSKYFNKDVVERQLNGDWDERDEIW